MSVSGLTPEQQERVNTALSKVPYANLLGITLEDIEVGQATLSLQIRDDLKQNHGVVHGGAIASLIDTATAFAIISLLPVDERVTTVDLTISYLKPLTEGKAKAVARIRRGGRRLIVVSADVTDDQGNLIATALSTYIKL